jgi:F-type H+-transporting ATPase subunit alpha
MKRKDTGAGVRLALAQYRELAAFAQFASDLDEATRKQLERGKLVTELMKQAQYRPMKIWEMALSLFAVNNDYMNDVEVNKVGAFEKALHDFIASRHAKLVDAIEAEKDFSKETEAALRAAIEDFKKTGSY